MAPLRSGSSIGERVIEVAQSLLANGAVAGTLGNVSARVGSGFVITPTRREYAELGPEELAFVLAGNADGPHPPSREWPLHAAIYAARPEVGAVVHTHSVHATAWSFLGEQLLPELEDNAYYATGPVLTAPPAPAGSEQVAEGAVRLLDDSRALLLGGHGVVATGADPEQAATIAAVIERQAEVAWILRGDRPGLVADLPS